jgi:ABC-type transport system substrate-binding protein
MFDQAHPGGRNFQGAPIDGKNPAAGDPEVTSLIDRIMAEFDVKKAQSLAHDYQRLLAAKMYYIELSITTPGFSVVWPVVGNEGVYRAPPGGVSVVDSGLNDWIDDTKPPIRRA